MGPAIIGFVIRFVGYSLLIGVPVRIAQYFWERAALDHNDILSGPHDIGVVIAIITPFVLALVGYGALRRPAIFVAMYIAGAALTAPFAMLRFASPGS